MIYQDLQATMDAKLDPCLGTCSLSLYICIHTEYIRIHIYIIHRIYIYMYYVFIFIHMCIYIYTYL